MATRWALQLAYDGTAFHGSQRQPDQRTVMGDLLEALEEVGAEGDPDELAFQAASRTDRGVSAAGNLVAFTTSFPSERLPEAVDAQLRDAWVVAKARVEETFLPRDARSRRYRYLLPPDAAPSKELERLATVFEGVHDFAAFAEVDDGASTEREILDASVHETPRALHVDVVGDAFLRHQVRRMVGALLAVTDGQAEAADLEASLEDGEAPGRGWGAAPPEHLVLLEVDHPGVLLQPTDAPGLRSTATQADLFGERFQLMASEAPD